MPGPCRRFLRPRWRHSVPPTNPSPSAAAQDRPSGPATSWTPCSGTVPDGIWSARSPTTRRPTFAPASPPVQTGGGGLRPGPPRRHRPLSPGHDHAGLRPARPRKEAGTSLSLSHPAATIELMFPSDRAREDTVLHRDEKLLVEDPGALGDRARGLQARRDRLDAEEVELLIEVEGVAGPGPGLLPGHRGLAAPEHRYRPRHRPDPSPRRPPVGGATGSAGGVVGGPARLRSRPGPGRPRRQPPSRQPPRSTGRDRGLGRCTRCRGVSGPDDRLGPRPR